MKPSYRILCLMLSLTCAGILTASAPPIEKWYVYYHEGRIFRQDKSLLKDDIDIPSNERMTYTAKTDEVYVLIPHVGEVKLGFSGHAEHRENAWVELLKDATRTKVTYGSLANMGPNNVLADDLKPDPHFSGLLLLQQHNRFLFSKASYPHADGFFLQIEQAGKNPDQVKLHTLNDTLYLDASNLKNNDPKTKFTLGYDRNGQSEQVANLHPVLDMTGLMDQLIGNLMTGLKGAGLSQDSLRLKCYFSLYAIYGKPCRLNFNETFQKNYDKINKR